MAFGSERTEEQILRLREFADDLAAPPAFVQDLGPEARKRYDKALRLTDVFAGQLRLQADKLEFRIAQAEARKNAMDRDQDVRDAAAEREQRVLEAEAEARAETAKAQAETAKAEAAEARLRVKATEAADTGLNTKTVPVTQQPQPQPIDSMDALRQNFFGA